MSELDGSAIGGRMKRYAKVTTTVGGLAARLAGERYLGMSVDKDAHAANCVLLLEG